MINEKEFYSETLSKLMSAHNERDTEYENTFEQTLEWLGPISRCDIACGFYGDTQWEKWNDNGEYVAFTDHKERIDLYKSEVERLKKLVGEVIINPA